MEFLKRYVVAASMGVVSLVCVLVGLLGVTVLRPPTQQVSSVESATDLIMTRGNVLSIVKDDVTVTATSKSGAAVTLGIGTTQDVKGWIGDAAYTEVIGVESDRKKLKAESHEAVSSGNTTPTGPSQSGVQSGAQPLKEPTSADLVSQLASSDMWFKKASGEGTVSLDLENVSAGKSALAVSAAGAGDLTLTLTWKVEQTNTLAIIAFLAACVFALIALALFLTRWQLLRLRRIRAARIEERRKADSLETASINSAAVAERVAADRGSSPAPDTDGAAERENVSGPSGAQHKTEQSDEWAAAGLAASPEDVVPLEPSIEDTAIRDVPPASYQDRREAAERFATPDPGTEAVGQDAYVPDPLRDTVKRRGHHDPERAIDSDVAERGQDDYVPDLLTDTLKRRGRHGLEQGPIDQDPPERATTDTGVIDLSGIRGGRTLPSRRALREARNNGEHIVVVDGQEFNTGLIPVTRPQNSEQTPTPTSAPDDDASATGGWTSIMSGWLTEGEEDRR